MGKVVPLSAARKRRLSEASKAHDTGTPQRTSSRRVVRAMKSVALVLLRALWFGLVDVLLSLLLFLARPARVVFKLGIIGLLLILVIEGMNHWRDTRLSIIAGVAILASILMLGFYDRLINCLIINKHRNH